MTNDTSEADLYIVTWYSSDTNKYYTKTYDNGRDWGQHVLVINMSENLRLVSTSMPN